MFFSRGRNPELPSSERLPPFLKDFFYNKDEDNAICTGQKILDVIDWQAGPTLVTDKDIRAFVLQNPSMISESAIIRARKLIEETRQKGLDLNLLFDTRMTGYKKGKLRQCIIKDLLNGRISEITRAQIGVFSYGDLLKESKQNLLKTTTDEESRKERIANALQEPDLLAPLTGCKYTLTNTHPIKDTTRYADKPFTMPQGAMTVDIHEVEPELISGDASGMDVTDSNGTLNEKAVQHIFGSYKQVSIVMTGGYVRGCLGSTFRSIYAQAKERNLERIDFHLPLDYEYDAYSYGYSKYIHQIFIPNYLTLNGIGSGRIFRNGILHDAHTYGERYGRNLKTRVFFWNTAEAMLNSGILK